MGLDMYLQARKYLSAYSETTQATYTRVADLLDFRPTSEDVHRSIIISLPAGYWRKANQVHNWFVQNVQENEDDCKDYYVSREQLEELKAICEKVVDDHSLAEELLPASSGFFFGSTAYDEWYFQDVAETIDIINKALNDPAFSGADFFYQASW